ncbi:hypothetical protein GCM10017655_24430 [Pseudomonas turukhanskensis]|uniref:Uncharacterized protein n=1 Tax=Pseudomonas turukhanskensis TaxID=1806536 RepID=A0A9W6NG63_9PSED|nr:hypothetical protein GCM10017655_24430 [Pseudomonas turukhanskensis]
MSLSLADKIYVAAVLIDVGGLLILFGVCLHMAYTKMDLLLEHLKNCKGVTMRAPLRHCGIWGNFLLIGGISGLVTFPKLHLKIGLLDVKDLQDLPHAIKRKLAILQWSTIVMLLILFFLAGVAHLGLV